MGYVPTTVIPRQMFSMAAQPFQGLKKEFKPRFSTASFGNPAAYSMQDTNDAWLQGIFGNTGGINPTGYEPQQQRQSFDYNGMLP